MILHNSWVLHIWKERSRIDLKTRSFKKLTTVSSELILWILALHFFNKQLISTYCPVSTLSQWIGFFVCYAEKLIPNGIVLPMEIVMNFSLFFSMENINQLGHAFAVLCTFLTRLLVFIIFSFFRCFFHFSKYYLRHWAPGLIWLWVNSDQQSH